jgi:hypothetical protein
MVYVEFEDEIMGAIPKTGLHGGMPPGKALVRHEAPPDPEGKGRTALGYLKPSGEIEFTHPVTKEVWYKSDQRWVYDFDEAAALAKDEPRRFVRVKG